MFEEGYTIEEAAKLLDMSDESMQEVIKRGSFKTFRKFGLFGPVLISKSFIDDIAPDIRAQAVRMGWTRADHAKRKLELEQSKQRIKEIEEKTEATRLQIEEEQREFFRQMSEITADFQEKMTKKMLDNFERNQDGRNTNE